MQAPYVVPKFQLQSFNCPHCHVHAKQQWTDGYYQPNSWRSYKDVDIAICAHCGLYTIWVLRDLVYPATITAPFAHQDMPTAVKADFEEARSIHLVSPRSAAALLRLSVQKLCIDLGEKGENLNHDIGKLVSKGLPLQVQQALDVLRVIGNNQVHPGVLDIRDDPETTNSLFELVNVIVEQLVSQPKKIKALFEKLPEGARTQITRRDRPVPKVSQS